MRKCLCLIALAVVASSADAQTNAANGSATLSIRNQVVCDSWERLAGTNCTDAEVQAEWCAENNKPAGAMCAASDTRPDEQKIMNAAQYGAWLDAQAAIKAAERLKRQRAKTLAAVEIAMLDPAARAAVCTAAKTAPRLSTRITNLLTVCN